MKPCIDRSGQVIPHYYVDEDGVVYSDHPRCRSKHLCKETGLKIVKPRTDFHGYESVSIAGGYKVHSVHGLVCRTYHGMPPKDMKSPTVQHIDQVKNNNHKDNLEWMTRGENSLHGFVQGTIRNKLFFIGNSSEVIRKCIISDAHNDFSTLNLMIQIRRKLGYRRQDVYSSFCTEDQQGISKADFNAMWYRTRPVHQHQYHSAYNDIDKVINKLVLQNKDPRKLSEIKFDWRASYYMNKENRILTEGHLIIPAGWYYTFSHSCVRDGETKVCFLGKGKIRNQSTHQDRFRNAYTKKKCVDQIWTMPEVDYDLEYLHPTLNTKVSGVSIRGFFLFEEDAISQLRDMDTILRKDSYHMLPEDKTPSYKYTTRENRPNYRPPEDSIVFNNKYNTVTSTVSKSIICTSETGDLNTFRTVSEASEELGIARPNISACLSGKRKSAGGYTFKFI